MAKRKGKLKLHLKEGALHKSLGVKDGEKIPASELQIKPGDSALTKKRKQFAINAKKWKHPSKKDVVRGVKHGGR